MYIYFDRNGTIKEVINDESIRKGSSDYNKIYCYLEGNPDIDDIWYLQKNPDGTLTNEVSFFDNIVTKAIPYDAKRDMKYFQDFEEYKFYVFTLSSSYLSQNGLVVATIRVAEDNTLWALGELTFNVQANIVNSDNDITQSQYDYLLLTISSYYSKTEIDNKLSLKADKSTTYTKTEVDSALSLKADKSDTYTIAQVDNMVDGLYVSKMYGNIRMSVSDYNGELVLDSNVLNRYVDPTWYHLQVGDKIVFNGNTNYRYWLAIKDKLSDSTVHDSGWKQETYVADAEVYVRITLAKVDNSNISIDFAELLGEDVITIHTRKPVTVRIGTVYSNNLNSYLFYSGTDTFNHRLRTSVIKFNKGDIINFKEYGTEYAWAFMGWNFDGTLDLDTGWKTSNFYVVPKDYKAVIIFKKSDYAQSLLLKGNIYYQKGLDGATNTATCVIVLDNKCVKTGDTITITNNTNAIDFKVDFLNDQWGQGTTTLQTIAYGTTSATVTANMSNVKNVVITIKKSDGTAFSNISSELLWYIYRTSNITKSNGEYFDTEAIYDVDFEVNGEVEPTKFNSNLVQIGHRGWDEYAPENTIPSFDLAYKLGCRFLEGDIRFTFDGVPVMLHDVTLNRTARNEDGTELSSTINISNITYAQALEYDFGIYQGDLYQGTKIPTFEEMIKWLKLHNDVYFQIDLTTGGWSNSQVLALYKIVAKYGMFDNLIWESGSSATISYLISLGVKPKNTMVSYYSSITTANVDTAYNLGCKVFSIQYSLATYSLIQYVISKGMKPYIWFDSADKYAYNVYRLTNLGVVGFYNTNISDIYALRWFKTFIGTDGNTASSITDKDTALLNQVYSDISTLEQETENLKQASLGNIMQETTYSNTNPAKSGKVKLYKLGGMSYKCNNLLNLADGENGFIDDSGSVVYRATQFVSDYIQVFSGKTYIVKTSQNFNNIGVAYYDTSKNISLPRNNNGTVSQVTISPSANGYIRIWFNVDNTTSLTSSIQETYSIMLNEGSTALPYEPYFEGIRDSAVTSVVSKDSNNTTIDTLTIPTAIQNLTGYGWGINDTCYNYIDFERKVFVQKVGRARVSDLSWVFDTSTHRANAVANDMQVATTRTLELLLSGYDSIHNGETYEASWDKVIYSTYPNTIYVTNKSYSSLEQFLTNEGNKYIYYPLATPVETDISAYLTTDTIDVEGGGSIEFTNTYSQAVPNEIAYLFNAVTLNNVVDSNGNPRFIEGNGTPATITGFTATQCKWSLSGTHLMLLLTGTMANGTELTNGMNLAVFTLPDFIKNKITPSWANNYIERKANILFADNWTTQTSTVVLGKFTNINIQQSGALTLTADRNFRVQFDLLIDSD